MEVSPDGTKLLVMGDFTSVAGQHRQQIFMLDLGASAATLDAWYSPSSTRTARRSSPTGCRPRPGLRTSQRSTSPRPATSRPTVRLPHQRSPGWPCADAAAAFSSASQSNLSHLWVNYTGCDSYFAVAADANDVYVAGHERWQDNALGCDHQGPAQSPDPASALSTRPSG
jgi:hypothetical protein